MQPAPSPSRCPPRRSQRGLSVVELMVGVAIGLLVLAGATRLFVDHLQTHRRALLEVRLHQDLRAAAELMTRGLRRAGYWQGALDAGGDAGAPGNPYRHIEPAAAPAAQTRYSHSRHTEDGVVDRTEASGFRTASGSLQMLVGGSWQALTDPAIVQITRLAVAPDESTVPLGHLCVPACRAEQPGCPQLQVRRYRIELHARSATDPALSRALHTTVRVRNDDLVAPRCPAL